MQFCARQVAMHAGTRSTSNTQRWLAHAGIHKPRHRCCFSRQRGLLHSPAVSILPPTCSPTKSDQPLTWEHYMHFLFCYFYPKDAKCEKCSITLKLNADADFQFQNIILFSFSHLFWSRHVRLVFEALLATCPSPWCPSPPPPSSSLASRQPCPKQQR